MDASAELPWWWARKTRECGAGPHAFGINAGVTVDTPIVRAAGNRLGLSKQSEPRRSKPELYEAAATQPSGRNFSIADDHFPARRLQRPQTPPGDGCPLATSAQAIPSTASRGRLITSLNRALKPHGEKKSMIAPRCQAQKKKIVSSLRRKRAAP